MTPQDVQATINEARRLAEKIRKGRGHFNGWDAERLAEETLALIQVILDNASTTS
jgi:hypothetical protein